MFADASALCAILYDEVDRPDFLAAILDADEVFVSPIVVWQCVRAITKHHAIPPGEAAQRFARFETLAGFGVVGIGRAEQRLAVEAFERFGKGRHLARLNMGDCFAYACARSHGLPLLFKGDDFTHTDIARVPLPGRDPG
ncbi:MAG: type II toxin-antitoxin system VapC family toxin [Brevundimonas sp.]|jgi:ribonuclease VapC|uniref:type II toxin-antitoxin system VapC family toxin n=1 Tax=Brevundimonas sp. TaxID=1871086 RepID=UPI003919DB3F